MAGYLGGDAGIELFHPPLVRPIHPDGRSLNPGYVTHTFTRLAAAADLPPIRLHDRRHGAASLSPAAGNDLKTVQALGHASIVLTADTYTHILPCLARQAAENTARLVLEAAREEARAIRRHRPARHRRSGRRGVPAPVRVRARR